MILDVLEVIVALLLTGVILLQMQGSGLSSSFGGSGEMFRSKRSAEKILTYSTVLLTALFAIISILLLIRK
jgi:protein translocase SecG subunit